MDKHNKNTITNEIHKSFTAIHTVNNKPFREKNYNSNIYRGLKLWITLFLIFLKLENMKGQSDFLGDQLNFERVRNAFDLKSEKLQEEFKHKYVSWPPQNIFIRSFKADLSLEVWLKVGDKYKLFKTYDVCKASGKLGPKYKQGDHQVPEGFYYIDRFNPKSTYYLSLGINYPNMADQRRSDAADLGGDIFIHGSCVTVGCLPMTDDIIKELYVLCVLAKSNGQDKIPVYIYPYRFNILNNLIYKTMSKHSEFWDGLVEDYQYFQLNRQLRFYEIDANGNYQKAN